ncbi:MAG: hypothetical protein RLY86_768 [Pseudomonadota bacterium]|jgi:fructose-1,6-bisphosphatase/inositol monophosphatase family enzyme
MAQPGLDPDVVSALLAEVAAVEIMPRFRNLSAGDIRLKGPGDVVTVADEAAERYLTSRLTDLLPGSTVLGEEGAAADPTQMARLSGDAPVWIIDPIDGTQNFTQGKPVFAVMVALVRSGRTVAGWIHDPIGNRTAVAEIGAGAWMGGERLRVAAPAPLAESTGALKNRFFEPDLARRIESAMGIVAEAFDLYCAGHEYLRLVTGTAHLACYRRLMPWDHAPGVLIHGEAGGWSARFDGSPYDPTVTGGGLLLAPDRGSWRDLHDVLFGTAAG